MKRLLFLLVLVSHTVFANTDTKSNTLSGSALSAGQTLAVSGLRYNAAGNPVPLGSRTFWVQNVYGLVKLSAAVPSTVQGSATVVVSITYQSEALIANPTTGIETLQYVPTTTTATLSVNLTGTDATDVSYFLAPNAQNVQVSVTSVANASNLNITLTTSVVTTGFDFLAANTVPAPTHLAQNVPVITSGGDLQVSWNSITGANTYELEWTYISNQGMDENLNPVTLSLNQIAIAPLYFKNNSSRVETANLTYPIPLIFEQGYILYRVRAVGQNIVNSNPVWVKSAWSYLDAGSPGDITNQTASLFPVANAYLYAGLENNINWQSSLSFAEEGKNKVVVSYHDGSSRNRQAVTRINTDQRTIVGETMYDYNGRPIIQTLPVPLSNQALGLSPNFNYVNSTTKTLVKSDITQDGCVTTGPQLSAGNGSSQYYSSGNTFSGTGGNTGGSILNKDNIPDAQLYPYSQTVYTADNTGRIATQSGIGKTNSLGSGKETQYMYGTPLQTELCRLFGSNVGQAVHYKKNAVVDPNGQTSVSYLDMDGKVVATALAGVNPPTSNLDNLTGNGSTARTISEDLIQTNPGTNLLSSDGTSKVFNKKFIVTGNQTSYTFDYTGTFGYYDIPCKIGSTTSTLNIDGVVDVYMTLQDKCGAILFSKDAHTAAGNTGQNQIATIPTVQKTLDAGTYQLVKEAVINEDKFQAYVQQYLASSCAMQLSDFQTAAQPVDLAQCNLTCTSCNQQVTNLINGGLLTPEQITTIKGLCDQLCDKTIGCTSYINAMMADMSPDGQYAKITPDRVTLPKTLDATQGTNGGAYTFSALDNIKVNNLQGSDASNAPSPQDFPLSIYNINNHLPLGNYLNTPLNNGTITKEYWRYPIFITRNGDNATHSNNYQILLDENNTITLGDVNGTGSNAILKVSDYLDANGQTFFVYVNKIVTMNDDQSITTTYSPDVTDVNKLTPVNGTAGLYKIPARWLKNISDFQNVWQSQWAYNLLPYHPEFPYYVDCITRDASNDFDYQVSSILKQSDAVTAGLITANGTPTVFEAEGQYNLYGGGAVSAYPGPAALYKLWMKQHMNNYQGSGTSIALMVNQIVNCPNGTTAANACGVQTANCTKTTIDTDDEWTTYWALYSSIKQEFIKDVANFKAVNGAYYNGCIGDVNYIGASDAWYFDQPKVFSVNSSSQHCFRFPILGTHCGWFNYNYTMNVPSFMVPNQLCYYGNAGYFADKTRRFFSSTETSAASSNNCATVAVDPTDPNTAVDEATSTITGPVYYVQPAPCAADAKNQMDAATLQAQITQYELCGTCPIASDVEALLGQLTSTNTLATSNVTTNCVSGKVTMGGVLSSFVLSGISDTPVISWSGSLSGDKRTLTGTILAGTTTRYTVTLSVPASTNPITASTVTQPILTTAYTLDQLLSLCCITPSTTTQGAFTIRGSFSGANLDDIYLNGTISGLNLTDCSFLPSCVLTSDAVHTATFLNILSAVPTGTGVNQTQLFSATPVQLFDNTSNNLTGTSNLLTYVDAVIDLLNIQEASATPTLINTLSPVWTVTTQNSGNIIVSGTLSYSLDQGVTTSTQTFQITTNGTSATTSLTGSLPSTATVANRPMQFVSLATLPYDPHNACTNCPSFGASMNAVNGNSFTAQPVIINTPFLNPVNCTPVVPATVNR